MIADERQNHTEYLSHAIEAPYAPSHCFDLFVRRLSDIYAAIASGHEYFTPTDGQPLHVGSTIDCAEHACNQSIVHRFVVRTLDHPIRVTYSSCPSHLTIRLPGRTVRSTSNTHVQYDFEETPAGGCRIQITIGIELGSRSELFFSKMFGGFRPWRRHCVEEMEGLGQAMR